ncbi:hypothetical protein J2W32_002886, partial [Variovorax boronicumulans]|nr:hypothetical protein [Variovorax boronicumulans]MDQ0053830.1 hypothetical protein [Variovorax boronicumulans]
MALKRPVPSIQTWIGKAGGFAPRECHRAAGALTLRER